MLLGAVLIACAITWPIAVDARSIITAGQFGGDPVGYLWDLWNNANHGLSLFGDRLQSDVAAPFGRPVSSTANSTLLVSVLPGWLIAKAASPIVAYNVMLIAAIALSGASMYLLVRWLGLGRTAAAWAGGAYMLLPYELVRATFHPPLAMLWCLPVVILAAIRWTEGPSWRRSVWLAIAFGLCWLSNPYYGFMGALVVAVVVAIGITGAWRSGGTRSAARPLFRVAGTIIPIVIVPLAALAALDSGAATSIQRNKLELEVYGAHLKDYVIPALTDPFVGGIAPGASWLRPGGERTVFLGIATIVLAVIGVVLAWRRWGRLTNRVRRTLVCGLPILILAVWISLASPYPVLGRRVEMPASWIFDAIPYLRAFARFGVLVAAIAIVLGAIGLALLMDGRQINTKIAIAATAIIFTMISLPMGGPLPAGVPALVAGTPPAKVPVWEWLRGHDRDGIVLESPAAPNELLDRRLMWAQTVHGHRIANGSLSERNLAADFLATVDDPRNPGVAQRIATAGIALVTVQPWAWQERGRQPPPPSPAPPGYRVLVSFTDGSAVWKVIAKPAPTMTIVRPRTWWNPEPINGKVWRFMRDEGRVAFFTHAPGIYTIRFDAYSFRGWKGAGLNVELPDGTTRMIATGPRPQPFAITTRLARGVTELVFRRDGGPAVQISPSDPRIVSVRISDWTVERVRTS